MPRDLSTPARSWFDAAALRRDLRGATLDATAALGLTLVIFVWLYTRVEFGTSSTTQIMPALADAGLFWMYYLCQAFGWSGMVWAWLTVLLGLLRSSRPPRWLPVSAVRLERWHRTTSLTTIGLMFAHAAWFFAQSVRDNAYDLAWAGRVASAFVEVFVPGGYPTGTGRTAILIGLLAFYLAIPLGLAFYARRSIGARMWRTLHASIIAVYVLSAWHTLLYSSTIWYDGWLRSTVWLLQLPIAGLLMVRLLTPAHRQHTGALDRLGRLAARAAASATIVVVLVVTASGRDGGRTPDVAGAEPTVTQVMIWAGFAVFVVAVSVAVWRTRRGEGRAGRT